MNKKKMMMFEIMSASLGGGGGADVSGVTATAPDVDEGKIFVDNTGSQVVGTSTYKADYIALRTDIDNLNDTLEPVLLGNGSDTNVYANVSNVTATAGDVDYGKVFVDSTGTEVTGSSTYKSDYTALNTIVGQTTATAADVAQGKVFVNSSGVQTTGTAISSDEDFKNLVQRPTFSPGANLTFPNGITSISPYVCYRYTYLYSVTIPNTVTSIGDSAFDNDYMMSSPTLPNNLQTIGAYAFSGCSSMSFKTVTFPSSLTSIGNGAYSNCSRLTTVTFLGTPTSIASNAFDNCPNLTTINVPWSSGEVSGARWGATNATIVYNYTPS